jgi:hypothetical protein
VEYTIVLVSMRVWQECKQWIMHIKEAIEEAVAIGMDADDLADEEEMRAEAAEHAARVTGGQEPEPEEAAKAYVKATALFDFVGEEDDDLSFTKGEVIVVTSQDDGIRATSSSSPNYTRLPWVACLQTGGKARAKMGADAGLSRTTMSIYYRRTAAHVNILWYCLAALSLFKICYSYGASRHTLVRHRVWMYT